MREKKDPKRLIRKAAAAGIILFTFLAYKEPIFQASAAPQETVMNGGSQEQKEPLYRRTGRDEGTEAFWKDNEKRDPRDAYTAVLNKEETQALPDTSAKEEVSCSKKPSGVIVSKLQNYSSLPSWAEAAAVINVSDGDTLYVQRADGSEWYVRLLECNTPESGAAERVGYAKETEYGKKASDYTKSLVSPGDVVFLSRDLDKDDGVSSDLDRYGRLLRVVWLSEPKDNWNTDEEMVSMHTLNGRLLTSGMAEAVFYDDRGYEDLFKRLESGAREKKAGLWAYEGAFERKS